MINPKDTTLRDEFEVIKIEFAVGEKAKAGPTFHAYIRGRLDTLISLSADCAEDVRKEAVKFEFEVVR